MEEVLELGSGERLENFEKCDRKKHRCLEQIVRRNLDVKDSVGEGSEGSEEYSRGNLF